jgi:hypothetical protein
MLVFFYIFLYRKGQRKKMDASHELIMELTALQTKYIQDVNRVIQTYQEKQKESPARNPKRDVYGDDDFVVEDDDEERINSRYASEEEEEEKVEEEKEEPRIPKRKRRAPQRYGKEKEKQEEDDDEKGEDCCSDGDAENDQVDADQWTLLKSQSYGFQKRHPWFRRHFQDGFDLVRSGLGHQGHQNNATAHRIWDLIANRPYEWSFKEVDKYNGTCNLCGQTKPIYYKGYDHTFKETWSFSSCCGPLAQAWQQFHLALSSGKSTLKEITRERDNVIEANSKKRSRR